MSLSWSATLCQLMCASYLLLPCLCGDGRNLRIATLKTLSTTSYVILPETYISISFNLMLQTFFFQSSLKLNTVETYPLHTIIKHDYLQCIRTAVIDVHGQFTGRGLKEDE